MRQDEAANLFLRRSGADASLPPVLIGSHLDTQPTGGRFDGALGVLAAFEVLEALEDADLSTARAVEVAIWTNEEEAASRREPWDRKLFPLAICRMNGEKRARPTARDWATNWPRRSGPCGSPRAAGFSRSPPISSCTSNRAHPGAGDTPIGVVTGIQETLWLEVELEGQAAHAGRRLSTSAAIPCAPRHDHGRALPVHHAHGP